MARQDIYSDFYRLASHEDEGTDFRIVAKPRNRDVAVVAPHGGGIEPGTSEIALAVAGCVHSLYLFEGLKTERNRDLHITSDAFNEPHALALVRQCRRVLAIHGEGSQANAVFIGGLDCAWGNLIDAVLTEAGFEIREHPNLNLQGFAANNICNRGRAAEGVQLEIGEGLRDQFFRSLSRRGREKPTELFFQFVEALSVCLE